MPRSPELPPPPPGVRYVVIPLTTMCVIADDEVRRRVDRFFYWPMIVLALLILPLLALEFLGPPLEGTWWWISAVALAVIWIAFFLEFVIKISIAESRFEYVKCNWLDVIILALPLLRPLRVAYLARTTRVFTLRGVGMKFLRYAFTLVVGLEATERMLERIGLRKRGGRCDPQQMTRLELIKEVRRLRKLTDRWEAWYEARQDHLTRIGMSDARQRPEERACDEEAE